MRAGAAPLLLLALASGCGGPSPDGGQVATPSPSPTTSGGGGQITTKIYLGRLVPAGRLKAVVGLTYRGSRTPACTGALIADDMVLTAAHCVCTESPTHVFVGENPLDTTASRGTFFAAGKAKPGYLCGRSSGSSGVDVAVVRVVGHIRSVAPVELATAVPAGDAIFLTAGYGATDTGGSTVDYRKREALIPVESASCSRPGDPERFGCQKGEEIVAGRIRTADTCKGDSGAPLLMPRPGTDGSRESDFVVAGVTSRGVNDFPTCGQGGIYEAMRPMVRDWIARAAQALRNGA